VRAWGSLNISNRIKDFQRSAVLLPPRDGSKALFRSFPSKNETIAEHDMRYAIWRECRAASKSSNIDFHALRIAISFSCSHPRCPLMEPKESTKEEKNKNAIAIGSRRSGER